VPLEWAGLALGASAWLLQRHRALTAAQGFALLALTGSVLVCAAAIETLAVAHEPRPDPDGANACELEGGLEGCRLDIPVIGASTELKDEASRHGCQL
jgi:hypothetical protein